MRIAVDHRIEILQTAAHLFAQRPFHEVLMDDVAHACGLAKGTIYRHYPNKEALYLAICLEWMDRLIVQLGKSARRKAGAGERLEEMIRCMAEQYHRQRDFFQVVQRFEGTVLGDAEWLKRRTKIRELFAKVIREGQRRGELRLFDANLAADMALGMARNLLRWGDPDLPAERIAHFVLDLLMNGMTTRRRNLNGAAKR
ncbi:MAG: TetR/AcrR family transcriptional regulator [Planctomycetota bacterium]|nr:TetR/AcrR family transcriptional regulator [Planctomycetota bacterium]